MEEEQLLKGTSLFQVIAHYEYNTHFCQSQWAKPLLLDMLLSAGNVNSPKKLLLLSKCTLLCWRLNYSSNWPTNI